MADPTGTAQAIPRIAITAGEPAGIGPDLLALLAQRDHSAQLIAVGSPELLLQRAQMLGVPLQVRQWHADLAPSFSRAGELLVAPIPLAAQVDAGRLDPANARHVIAMLEFGIDGCADGRFDALVTAPVHKGIINDAGVPFSGHTEFFAERTHTAQVVMMLATEQLRVALATTHLPLAEVSRQITGPHLEQVLRILERDLREKFGFARPRVAVLGLNPHAGESGHLGREEIDTIEPCLQRLRGEGMQLLGPLPADTAFTPKYLDQVDAVLAMYHDQGLPVLKYQGFGRAVNITLGLPVIRTSVDHGTALELAGTGRIDSGSLHAALALAEQLARQSLRRLAA